MFDIIHLALATFAFVGSHLAMSHPLRLRLVQNMGEDSFRIVYSLVSFATLGWMIIAYLQVNSSIPFWIAPDWAWDAGSVVMLLALILLVGSLVRNPAFPHPGAEKLVTQPARGVYAITRHPMNWSFILWAIVHIALWGSPPNLIVAGGILILAFAGSIGQDRKKVRVLGQKWAGWQNRTSFVPFGAVLRRKVKLRDTMPGWLALGGGFALWAAITSFHEPSVSPLGWLGLL